MGRNTLDQDAAHVFADRSSALPKEGELSDVIECFNRLCLLLGLRHSGRRWRSNRRNEKGRRRWASPARSLEWPWEHSSFLSRRFVVRDVRAAAWHGFVADQNRSHCSHLAHHRESLWMIKFSQSLITMLAGLRNLPDPTTRPGHLLPHLPLDNNLHDRLVDGSLFPLLILIRLLLLNVHDIQCSALL